MIAIIDYGLGNVRAFVNVYKVLNIPTIIAKRTEDFEDADKVILPGVGSFDHAMQMLEKSGMRQSLDEFVLRRHVPVLGICVGMQMLAVSSEEGKLPGLGWINGDVKRFDPSSSKHLMRVPHMGWNEVIKVRDVGLLQGIGHDARFYFLHSYYFQCHRSENVVAVTDYDGVFACVVNSGNVFGVQFHPEKSHRWGIRLLENYARS